MFSVFEKKNWFSELVATVSPLKLLEWYFISAFVNQSNTQPSAIFYIDGKLVYSSYRRIISLIFRSGYSETLRK